MNKWIKFTKQVPRKNTTFIVTFDGNWFRAYRDEAQTVWIRGNGNWFGQMLNELKLRGNCWYPVPNI
jgi:hypothetical protein